MHQIILMSIVKHKQSFYSKILKIILKLQLMYIKMN